MAKAKEQKPKEEKIHLTHNLGCGINNPSDCVSRTLHAARLSNGITSFHFETVYKEGEEPLMTDFNLSNEAFQMMTYVCMELSMNLNQHKHKGEENE